jgi:predicted nucleic acid-binding protein
MLLLDTCVISEGIKARPDARVVHWMKFQNPAELFISAVTLGELHYGVAKLASGAKQRELGAWVSEVEKRFADRVVVMDDAVARQWGYLRAMRQNIPIVDVQIAATAMAYGFTFVTRNVKHFRFDGLTVVDPWED